MAFTGKGREERENGTQSTQIKFNVPCIEGFYDVALSCVECPFPGWWKVSWRSGGGAPFSYESVAKELKYILKYLAKSKADHVIFSLPCLQSKKAFPRTPDNVISTYKVPDPVVGVGMCTRKIGVFISSWRVSYATLGEEDRRGRPKDWMLPATWGKELDNYKITLCLYFKALSRCF